MNGFRVMTVKFVRLGAFTCLVFRRLPCLKDRWSVAVS